jgi:hypothetical protein
MAVNWPRPGEGADTGFLMCIVALNSGYPGSRGFVLVCTVQGSQVLITSFQRGDGGG